MTTEADGVQQVGVLFFARLCPRLLSVIPICLSCRHSYPMCLGYVSMYIHTYLRCCYCCQRVIDFISADISRYSLVHVFVCVSIHIVYSHFINLVIY